MRCTNCGSEIPEGQLYCKRCGKEVRIVPDYNPLDDVLAAQVKGGIDGGDRPLEGPRTGAPAPPPAGEKGRERSEGEGTRPGPCAVHPPREAGPPAPPVPGVFPAAPEPDGFPEIPGTAERGAALSRMTGTVDPERRRKMAEKKREKKKKLRRRIILGFIILIAAVAAAVFFLYRNSYAGQIGQGNRAFSEGNYDQAAGYFNNAIGKAPKRGEAYTALAKVYLAKDDQDSAEQMFLDALESYPDEVPIYEACIAFYIRYRASPGGICDPGGRPR